ncbi:right-handed parallel beta-helix repeat-containing protein [Lysobacter sp. Root916]|uniref:right-handed parallel beta-helix repeat-containing protein n=1 Tax=Lysobacter sp. Root916 TaxID=1736606 RepID=UPI000ACF4960|nr:right-handed parallel beta-helix repeat-containing protein [Lysobacter sp. Root916]
MKMRIEFVRKLCVKNALKKFSVSSALILLMFAACAVAPASAAGGIFTVYMAPADAGGSDFNDGLSTATPVATLAEVQKVLTDARPDSDVEVRIRQGVYEAPPLGSWTFYVPGHTVSFLPIDYVYGAGGGSIAGLPVFRNKQNSDGTYPNGPWLIARVGGALPNGGDSRLRFYYLQVEKYSDGLSVAGLPYGEDTDGGNPAYYAKNTAGLNRNVVFGMYFLNIGTYWTGNDTGSGYGAIVLSNSSNNLIENSHFIRVENQAGQRAQLLHGVYLGHFSDNNSIKRNRFYFNSGAPVKVRDRSNFNTFDSNTFERAGATEFYADDVCDPECQARFPEIARALECAGYHNSFINNRLISAYQGGMPERVWRMFPWRRTDDESQHYAGDPARCTLPANEVRLYVSGNL